jgi:hypothetical protein
MLSVIIPLISADSVVNPCAQTNTVPTNSKLHRTNIGMIFVIHRVNLYHNLF